MPPTRPADRQSQEKLHEKSVSESKSWVNGGLETENHIHPTQPNTKETTTQSFNRTSVDLEVDLGRSLTCPVEALVML